MLAEIERRLLSMGSRPIYYNRDGTPSTMREWSNRFDRPDRIVSQCHLPNGIYVSTVFLGLDHSFGDGPPLIFESMAFAAEEWLNEKARELNARRPKRTYHPDLDQVRYSTEEAAIAGHMAMCEKFFAGSRTLTWPADEG